MFATANAVIMNTKLGYRHDLLEWQFKRLKREGETLRSISRRSGVPQATLCDTINGTTRPFPITIVRVYKALGLDPSFAFNFDLKTKTEFRSAVL